ncbi:MAG: sulfotransferase [Thermodesulfobacteriota bacterium]
MIPVQTREDIHRDLHENYLVKEEPGNRICARRVLEFLFHLYRPESILDVGCGLGTWISVARSLGAGHIVGVDGPWLDRDLLVVEKDLVLTRDLDSPLDLGGRFDLVISLEVAEHLPASSAQGFIDSLVGHGDVVLFSAAIPHQGGHGHVNEQWPQYWAELFEARSFVCLDILRPALWHDGRVYGHLRQNMLLYVSEARMERPPFPELAARSRPGPPLSLVHPEVYGAHFENLDKWKELGRRYERLVSGISRSGHYYISAGDGEIRLTRMEMPDEGKDREASSEPMEEEIRRGEELFQVGEVLQALDVFDRILRKDPCNPLALNDRGVALHTLGRHLEAEQDFLKAIDLNACDRDALENLLLTYRASGRHEEADRISLTIRQRIRKSPSFEGPGPDPVPLQESGPAESDPWAFHYWKSQERTNRVFGKTLFFVIGCPKSGTTWLQYILDAHPQIQCTGEGDFNLLMRLVEEVGTRYNTHIQGVNRNIGTTNYCAFSQDDLRYLFVSGVAALLAGKEVSPAVRCIGSKNPVLIDAMEVYVRLLPQARFIHIIRDGRDVVTSAWFNNLRANEEATRRRWPGLADFVGDSAGQWSGGIRKARSVGLNHPDRYLEITYEQLHMNPDRVIRSMLRFLHVDASDPMVGLCAGAGSFRTLSRGRVRGDEDPRSFFRKGVVGDWRNHFDEEAHRVFMDRAGSLLGELGYS